MSLGRPGAAVRVTVMAAVGLARGDGPLVAVLDPSGPGGESCGCSVG